MFLATIKAKIIKNIVDSISDLSQSIVFNISDEGIGAQTMDSSHVSIAIVQLNVSAFIKFETDKNYSIGINIANISKILKFSSTDSIMTLSLVDEDKISITLNDSSSKSEFEMGLMDIDTEFLEVPEMEYDCRIKMPCVKFQKIFKDLSQMGDDCEICISDDSVSFETSGENLKAKSVFTRDDMEFSGLSKSRYSIRYFQSFSKATPLSSNVTMEISSGVPVFVNFTMVDDSSVKFYLAPKIEDEDDEDM